jgi:hypothetical protein
LRTLIIIATGVTLAVLCLFGGRYVAGREGLNLSMKAFLVLWLTVGIVNLWIGVAKAGYSIKEELPIALLVFAPPAAIAICLRYFFTR